MLLRAFEMLREQNFNLAAANEDQVTAALRSTIESDLRQSGEVRGFDKRKFETVIRQGQWANYNGTRITKTPDPFFKLRDDEFEPRPVLSEFEGLFIEAKPVDDGHAVGSKYCGDGLICFVRGDYAWAMQEAIMLAYARRGRTIAGHLVPAMTQSVQITALNTVRLPQPCLSAADAACSAAEAVYTSQQGRNFEWPDGKGRATDITVYHLLHRCSC